MSKSSRPEPKRVEWKDEDGRVYWAILDAYSMTWGQRLKARKAAAGDFWQDFAPVVVTMSVTKWSENTDPTEPESWEGVPGEFGDECFSVALALWQEYQAREQANPTEGQSEN